MRRTTRLSTKRVPPPDSSDEDEPKKTKKTSKKYTPQNQNQEDSEGSSSESDIENYLKPADQLDLNSSFFQTELAEEFKSFAAIENNIFAGINRLSDSNSESDEDKPAPAEIPAAKQTEIKEPKATTSKINFQQLHDYTKKLEEAKQLVEKYEASKKAQQAKQKLSLEKKSDDISNLLALGEAKLDSSTELRASVHSSDYESYSESEKEDWEEVEHHDIDKESKENIVPKDGVQITVALPEVMRKKKGVDLIACMKRRLNRIRKENQVLVHKVHLLCWLGHGNYVNGVLNNEELLALALSLMPSQYCYPPERTDLSYLEQIVKWYSNAIPNVDKLISKNVTLEKALKLQINRRQAYNKKMLVYIFICLLRSLGIQCRLILSFEVAPIRPPASELHSLSTKSDGKEDEKVNGQASSSKTKPQNSPQKVEVNKDKKTKMPENEKPIKKEPKLKKPNLGNLTDTHDRNKNKSETQKKKSANAKEPPNKTGRKTSTSKAEPDKTSDEQSKRKSRSSTKQDKNDSEKGTSKTEPDKASDEQSKWKSRLSTKQDKNDSEKGTSKSKKCVKTDTKKASSESQKIGLEEKPKRRLKTTNETSAQSKTKKPDLLKLKTSTKSKSTSELDDAGTKTKRIAKTEHINNNKDAESIPPVIPQVDGANDSDDEPSTSQKVSKPNLKKLSQEEVNTCPKKHPKRLKSLPSYIEVDSDEDFQPESPKKTANTHEKSKPSANLKKLQGNTKLRSNQRLSKSSDRENSKKTTKKSESPKPTSVNLKKPKSDLNSSTKGSPTKPAFRNVNQYLESISPKKRGDIRDDIISIVKGRMIQEKAAARSKLVKSHKARSQSDYDSDYAPEPVKKKHHDSDDEFYEKTKVKVKQRIKVKRDSDADEKDTKKKKGVDVWVEVFLENEEKWISADVSKGAVHCVSELYSRASHPVTYIVAWNNDNSIKDITQRYCTNWNTVTRKLRIDKNWWEATLRPFKGRTTPRDKEEDEELARLQLQKPLPTTISEYKDHPLYVLKRHLLKFEALYPAEPITLGFIRNEAVYSRDCVHTLHSREVWIKYAKVVKLGEQPYKIVKARPKYDKLSGQVITDQPLELFGKWQVGDYVPPVAENGIVPRNAYGNVELFKACMLPKGTVHLQLPSLNKVAKKMNIDCAPAVVGFDFHCGGSHPTFDGFVVCEEHSESLIAGWYMEQEEQEKREQEKFEKRVYGNWRKLIKGLLIRERLKKRYNFGEPSQEGTAGNKRKSKGPKVVSKKRRLCSDSESDVEDS